MKEKITQIMTKLGLPKFLQSTIEDSPLTHTDMGRGRVARRDLPLTHTDLGRGRVTRRDSM